MWSTGATLSGGTCATRPASWAMCPLTTCTSQTASVRSSESCSLSVRMCVCVCVHTPLDGLFLRVCVCVCDRCSLCACGRVSTAAALSPLAVTPFKLCHVIHVCVFVCKQALDYWCLPHPQGLCVCARV